MNIRLAPSILSADFSRLREELTALESAGADLVHIDVMDGRFVPNISLGPPVIRALRPHCGLPFDVHLMIVEPERYIDAFADAGADYLTIHLESTKKIGKTLEHIRSRGVIPGLTIKPGTDAKEAFPYLKQVGMVLVMSVEPGFGGQKFIPSAYEKLRMLRAEAERLGLSIDIEVDGGVNIENVRSIAEAGANVIVAGSAVFEGGRVGENIQKFRQALR